MSPAISIAAIPRDDLPADGILRNMHRPNEIMGTDCIADGNVGFGRAGIDQFKHVIVSANVAVCLIRRIGVIARPNHVLRWRQSLFAAFAPVAAVAWLLDAVEDTGRKARLLATDDLFEKANGVGTAMGHAPKHPGLVASIRCGAPEWKMALRPLEIDADADLQ